MFQTIIAGLIVAAIIGVVGLSGPRRFILGLPGLRKLSGYKNHELFLLC